MASTSKRPAPDLSGHLDLMFPHVRMELCSSCATASTRPPAVLMRPPRRRGRKSPACICVPMTTWQNPSARSKMVPVCADIMRAEALSPLRAPVVQSAAAHRFRPRVSTRGKHQANAQDFELLRFWRKIPPCAEPRRCATGLGWRDLREAPDVGVHILACERPSKDAAIPNGY